MIKQLFQHFHPLNKLEKQRKAFLAQNDITPKWRALFQQPYPKISSDLTALSFLVIDFETTGLNSMMDNILSVAAVPIDNLTLDISKAWHQFVAEEQEVKKDTAVINHILPQMLNDAETLDDTMNRLFELIQGRIVIAHGSNIEKRFILHYLKVRYNLTQFPLLWLDTLKIERSLTQNQDNHYQLTHVRNKYHLPEYVGHNALIDAISAGELFLAQLENVFGQQKKILGEIYRRSHE
ncbi:3'-5' exonuclease [Caviibacterium pharyngocola]|uniref:3'-5' exonuclease n=1 Tax=Caviibacterium pharyngocola TaxID=28159 RepID=A0A2M8RYT8_9PAST|nr:3'-5' exonuclease [Caviibacterium pharyngocola]PJG84045.1 3'-5' exonuclease [Caviibacterium pharyngocola]